jgi:hypothetical protein
MSVPCEGTKVTSSSHTADCERRHCATALGSSLTHVPMRNEGTFAVSRSVLVLSFVSLLTTTSPNLSIKSLAFILSSGDHHDEVTQGPRHLGRKFAKQIPAHRKSEPKSSSLAGVSNIVETSRKITIADKSTCSGSHKVG